MESQKKSTCAEARPKQHNVVFHFKVCDPSKVHHLDLDALVKRARERNFSHQLFHNFVVFRREALSFTLFFKSGHVNCSGTRTSADIHRSLEEAFEIFGKRLTEEDTTISSSTWSGRFPHTLLNIPCSKDALHLSGKPVKVSLRPSKFPGAVVRCDHFPTLLIFRNGKYIIVGAKSYSEVEEALENIKPSLRCLCCIAQS